MAKLNPCIVCERSHEPGTLEDLRCQLQVMTEERDELWAQYQRAADETWRLQQALNQAVTP